ncbi:ImmA/IrrE family metallo-endopeptidase [Ramlibacter pallidus]|uniref:ImmA/IrrE family metallo-endopeptidase n=1 Tax=Ramlibacter pallidus TaxID=2780087 RepID=A0ABR9S3D1_9BURK|nr:ImmA/IrrE family metallo-endopeptidase [Ramlibacter pallidus]MBE7368019.1 ImmA/IrrE family metallo-endopeptidase [Ramlibacter pallidus]
MAAASSTHAKGNSLERRIRDLFQSEIDADRFWAKKQNCKVFWKKGYFSKDRGTEIVFDVAIELYLPGARDYSCLVLIECKNYSHSVPVDDAEEFFAKVQQVAAANVKAVIASTASFQHGTREFAKSKGMGLVRYFGPEDFKWELKRSPSASAQTTPADDAELVGSALSVDTFHSLAFDLYLQSPVRDTNSLWDFFEDLVLDSALTKDQARRVANRRSKLSSQIPFYDKDELESKAADILAALDYSGGEVDLDSLCERESALTGLKVERGVAAPASTASAPVLGRITFDPPLIQVFAVGSPHRGRDRFTLAHELSQHLLNHGRFLVRESCDDKDFELQRSPAFEGADVARMEFQANFLAAGLLMPRTHVAEDFQRVVRALDIPNRGYGPLYVDNQPCNLQSFDSVTGGLMQRYGVSRSAVKIRLESLGLLRDARRPLGFRSVHSILAGLHDQ